MQKFKFIKEYVCSQGVIPVNSEIQIIKDVMYFNGGLISKTYQDILENIINNDINEEYVKEIPLVKNEF